MVGGADRFAEIVLLPLFTQVPTKYGILRSSIVHSLRTAQIHRQFIAIHKVKGERAKTRKEEYKKEQPVYFLLRGGERRWPKRGTDRSILFRVDVGKGENNAKEKGKREWDGEQSSC